jgi:hypothetical protein
MMYQLYHIDKAQRGYLISSYFCTILFCYLELKIVYMLFERNNLFKINLHIVVVA